MPHSHTEEHSPDTFEGITLKVIRVALAIVSLALMTAAASHAQPVPATNIGTGAFFQQIVGDWIGICDQTTDGQPADSKYFHVRITKTDDSTYVSVFRYYRLDQATGNPVQIGESKIATTVHPDGTAKSEIVGAGTILVDEKPKQQEHELVELLTATGANGMMGDISGKISVSGMPLGLGKNGSVGDGKSTWSLVDGTLSFRQSLKASFKVFFMTKSFTVVLSGSARRGSDVAELMKKGPAIAERAS